MHALLFPLAFPSLVLPVDLDMPTYVVIELATGVSNFFADFLELRRSLFPMITLSRTYFTFLAHVRS